MTMEIFKVDRGAVISDDGMYRYVLTRKWSDDPSMCFIMLNPSTADAEVDDPTIRRCMVFAQREHCGSIVVVNLFAYRATRPSDLIDAQGAGIRVIGPDNQMYVRQATLEASITVAAWGASQLATRGALALTLPADLRCLGVTKSGAPRHPLYVKGDQPLVPWTP